jgi:cellulose synthase/poly-beta-1,6-N-acetylglucosamine synthase-like glycosyltransferase
LKKVNGWDEYNVTEDADITYRLYRMGYKIKMLDSYTNEETVINIKAWINQRSRWIKGHLMTFLVQSRVKLKSKNKIKFYFSLCYFTFLYPVISILFPIGIFLFLSQKSIVNTEYKIQYYLLLLGFFYCNTVIPLIMVFKHKGLNKLYYACFIYPFYLLLYFIPAYIALFELFFKPHYWNKTDHGQSKFWNNIKK